jgi:hypothetical protein
MVDDAAARVNELEETVTRLQRENEEGRLSRQNTPSISHEPKRSTKLPDPLIFEGRDQDLDSWLSRMRNKLLANGDHYPTVT